MKKLFKVISILLVVCLVFPTSVLATDTEKNIVVPSAETDPVSTELSDGAEAIPLNPYEEATKSVQALITELLAQREALVQQYETADAESAMAEIDALDKRLAELGEAPPLAPWRTQEEQEKLKPVVYMTKAEMEAADRLLDERVNLAAESWITSDPAEKARIEERLAETKQQMIDLGIRFLTWEEVLEEFPDIKERAQRMGIRLETGATRDADFNTWTLSTYTYTMNNITYAIQQLTCSPLNEESPLMTTKTVSKSYGSNYVAGNTHLFSTRAYGTNIFEQEVPGGEISKSIYSAVRSSVPGVTSSTVVALGNMSYNLVNSVIACFTKVKPTGSEGYFTLCASTSKTETIIGYSIPSLRYQYSNGYWSSYSYAVSGSTTMYATPSIYANIEAAVNTYLLPEFGGLPDHIVPYGVSEVYIYGPNGGLVHQFEPDVPALEWHCEV